MSPTTLLLMCVVATVAALVPTEKSTRLRAGLAICAAGLVWFVSSLWPTPVQTVGGGAAPETLSSVEQDFPRLLTFLVFAPIVSSILILFMPRQGLRTLRIFTYAMMAMCLGASLLLLKAPMTPGWHFQHTAEWIPALGIRYHVALDGISLWLVVLTTFTTPIAMYASFGSVKTRIKELCFAFLFLQGAMIGAFVSLDLFLFYVFWELMLVPMYVMIGIWGGADKVKAAIKFFLYTMTGSVLMLAAIVYLVWTHQKLTGHYSFDYLALVRVALPKGPQMLCYLAFSIAFFVKVPMWPVHTWLPDAHVQAPTGGSVILAAVMLKLGTYAYMRFSMGLFPLQASSFAPNFAGIAILGGIVYAALVAWKQDDVKRLIAYSSVAHLGYIMLGLFGASPAGMQGALIQMVNHGISTGLLFLLVGVIYDRRHTRLIAEFGGLAKPMPVFATLFLIATFASVGVPGTNGFVGEFMIIMGTYSADGLRAFSKVHTIGAAFGVILSAVYMLSVVQRVFFGPVTNPKNKNLKDISARESLAMAPLVMMIFLIGLFPNVFLSRSGPAVGMLNDHYRVVSKYVASLNEERYARLIPLDQFNPKMLEGSPTFEAKADPAAPVAVATPSPVGGAR